MLSVTVIDRLYYYVSLSKGIIMKLFSTVLLLSMFGLSASEITENESRTATILGTQVFANSPEALEALRTIVNFQKGQNILDYTSFTLAQKREIIWGALNTLNFSLSIPEKSPETYPNTKLTTLNISEKNFLEKIQKNDFEKQNNNNENNNCVIL